MRRLLFASLFGLSLTGHALATGTISCEGGRDAGIVIGIGSVPGLAVVNAEISAEGRDWRLSEGNLAVAQAFQDADSLRVDFSDANISEIIARLRLFQASAADDTVLAGTLEMPGIGAYAVTCEGP